MRTMEPGTSGGLRGRLDSLVLAGRKTATTCLPAEYVEEAEGLESVGERMALLDDDGHAIAVLEITGVEQKPFVEVTWEHAAAEGEGDASLEEWRMVHRGFWRSGGAPVEDGTPVVCLTFRVVKTS